jgi:NADH-quinone oxidoreductase subunit N
MQIPQVNWSAISPPLVLIVWGIVLLLIGLFIENKRTVAYLSLVGVVGAALAPLGQWNAAPVDAFSGMVVIDNTAITLDWILLLIAAITVLFSIDYNQRLGIERGEYYTLLLLCTAAMMFMAHGRNLIVLFLALEWLSIGLYVLAGFAYPQIRSGEAAMKYLLYGAFAAGFLIYGIALLFGATGTADLQGIGTALRDNPALRNDPLLLAGAGLILVGFSYKISLVPFHMWTPDVYEGSPTPVTG